MECKQYVDEKWEITIVFNKPTIKTFVYNKYQGKNRYVDNEEDALDIVIGELQRNYNDVEDIQILDITENIKYK